MPNKFRSAIVIAAILCVTSCERPAPEARPEARALAAPRTLASDGTQANIQSIHDSQAVDGDIITLPAGSDDWTGTLNITKAITLQGGGAISTTGSGGKTLTGTDVTTVVDRHPSNEHKSLGTQAPNGKTVRVTGICFKSDANTKTTQAGMIQVSGGANSIRIDHCHFLYAASTSGAPSVIAVYGGVTGVIDHNYFDQPPGNGPVGIYLQNGVMPGDAAYNQPDDFGTDKFIFIEDNKWRNGYLGDANTGGQRFVYRYNDGNMEFDDNMHISAGYVANHGITGGRGRSTRVHEYYKNTMTARAPGLNKSPWPINGGTAIIWGETITQYRYATTIGYTRKDNSTYPYGTPPGGWGNCTGTSGTVWDGPGGYPCLDQPGRGQGDLLSGNFPNIINTRTGNAATVQQKVSPIYIFNCKLNPAGFSPISIVGNQASSLVQANREFFTQFGQYGEQGTFDGTRGVGEGTSANRPATLNQWVGWWETDTQTLYVGDANKVPRVYYKPYVYPHPLASGGGTSPTPVPTQAPTATILPTATPNVSPTPTPSPTPMPTPAPSPIPSATPAPTAAPTATATATSTPVVSPTPAPTSSPTAAPTPPAGQFIVWGYGERDKGNRYSYLNWSGSNAESFDIYRDGQRIASVFRDTQYTDSLGKGGNQAYVYKVCEAGTQTCTSTITVSF
jgi:hypothetical protein